MPQFLYYVPGAKGPAKGLFEKIDLDHALVRDAVAWRETRAGPDGKEGVVIAHNSRDPNEVGYWPDKQRWRQGPSWWLGWDTGETPGPDDLARGESILGRPLALRDSRSWLIPSGNPAADRPQLPYRLSPQPDGTEAREVVEAYQGFCTQISEAFELFCRLRGDWAQWEQQIDEALAWSIARRALAIMYRVGPVEIDALELVDSGNVNQVVGLTMDLDVINRVMADLAPEEGAAGTGKPLGSADTPGGSSTEPGVAA